MKYYESLLYIIYNTHMSSFKTMHAIYHCWLHLSVGFIGSAHRLRRDLRVGELSPDEVDCVRPEHGSS